MTRIGLLSDTHGYCDENMLAFFENVDEIWHAGDVGNGVIERLKTLKPVRAVYGNIDDQLLRMELNEVEHFKIEEVNILMVHIGGYPGKYSNGISKLINLYKPNIFVSGHSHILKVIFDKKYQCLHMNPGAAGISGFHHVRTMIRFVIDGNNIRDLEIWEKPRS